MEGKYALLLLIPAIFMLLLALGDHLLNVYASKHKDCHLFGVPIYSETEEDNEEWKEIETEDEE